MCGYCTFSEGGFERNYSVSNRNEWKMRSNTHHSSDVLKIMQCKTTTERKKVELQLGC